MDIHVRWQESFSLFGMSQFEYGPSKSAAEYDHHANLIVVDVSANQWVYDV